MKQQQQKLTLTATQHKLDPSGSKSNGAASSNVPYTIVATKTSASLELRETIEHLAQCLFDFLRQGLRVSVEASISVPQANSTSPPTSPVLPRSPLPDSSSLNVTYAQYAQLWVLIEHTMNWNFALEVEKAKADAFDLPKEAYLAMFQEINRYASSANQTYLIDSGINTSQLRRKHHFRVLLMSLKFKFQLFLINLLK